MLRFLKLLGILLVVLPAHAVEVTDLYQAKVTVVSQSANDRNNALKRAMQAVLLKVGGQRSVLNNQAIKQGVSKYQQYIVQFSYKKENEQRLLIASFNEKKINQLFHQAQLPLWGNLRPQILLWLVQEQGLARNIIAESSLSIFPKQIQTFSIQRGLPISLPLMDLTDLNDISTADVWGRFSAPIKAASTRYQAEAVAVIRISNSSLLPQNNSSQECDLLCRQDQYALDWRLFTDAQTTSANMSLREDQNSIPSDFSINQLKGNDVSQLLTQALADITQQIYQYYALNITDNRQIEINVANINSMQRYVDVNHFLNNLSSVNSVQLISAQGENRRFLLHLLGSKSALLASLKLNKQLQQYVDPLAVIDVDAIPIFYWDKP